MKILHFSDSHIGIDTHGSIDPETKLNIRVLDALDSLDAMIDMAVEEKVDIALFAGDAFHRHSPTQSYVNEFGRRMLRLRRQCPVVLLVGNHDMPGGDRASALEIYKTLEVQDIIVGNKCELLKIETNSGILQVVTIPYPNRTWLDSKDVYRNSAEIVSRMLKEETALRIRNLASQVDTKLPAVMLGHFTAEGCQYSSERSAFISNSDAAVSLDELLLPVWDYVALGHVHKHQDVSKGIEGVPPVVYAGSTDRVDFGEEKDKKGFVLIDIVNKLTSWEFIDVNARPFKTLEYHVIGKDSTNKILDKIENVSNLEGAIVRVIITPKDELTKLSIDEGDIKELLVSKGVFWINSFTIKRPENFSEEKNSNRSVVITTEMSRMEMVASYLRGIGKEGKDLDSLVKLYSNIANTCEVENV